jgi:hypothetical protein
MAPCMNPPLGLRYVGPAAILLHQLPVWAVFLGETMLEEKREGNLRFACEIGLLL